MLKDVYKVKAEWVAEDPRPIVKTIDGKFFACPMSVITENTWSIINLVNSTTDTDCNILHLPYPGENGAGSYLEQPKWYRDAVNIVRDMRLTDRSNRAEAARLKAKRGARNGK